MKLQFVVMLQHGFLPLPSLNICMDDWCVKEFNFWSTDKSLLPGEKKWVEDDAVIRGDQKFHSNLFGSLLHGINNEK